MVIENLKKIEAAANEEGMLDLMETKVRCGSPACVAGWYAIAADVDFSKRVTFMTGANLIAGHLGVGQYDIPYGASEAEHLVIWMDEHPEIWGNENGQQMFCGVIAYDGLKVNSKNPMTIIIKHWEGIRDRVTKYWKTRESLDTLVSLD